MYVDDESFIDMATSISGSGPAYIFMLMESMIDAGVHMGFPREKVQCHFSPQDDRYVLTLLCYF